MENKVTTVTIKEENLTKIEELKKAEGRTMAGVINEAIKAYYRLVMSDKRRD